ncbi:putative transporter [Neolecta irregularis DAH-3]|uniref:Putative transporter n=1 Tax=Neolecta irregularis (strain DAH-3) TaxID=1198029 RepID=A0A1U7LMU9_NEOID|nr:putative transporter [Neolecta irregularis DAH-3]|eukprot:OLL23851.1 putative transporter [Neolecta irregularis DAH-3]
MDEHRQQDQPTLMPNVRQHPGDEVYSLQLASSASSLPETKIEEGVDLERQESNELELIKTYDGVSNDLRKDEGLRRVCSHGNVVGWESEDDPANPRNWIRWRKSVALGIVSMGSTFSPLASSMFAPGVSTLLMDFHTSSTVLPTLVVSVFVLGYAAGPLILGPLSEIYGRAPVTNAASVLFFVFTILCAKSTSLNMLIGMRFLAGLVGSSPLTIGGGIISDLFAPEERGTAVAIFSFGPLVGPVIGPIAGGFIAETIGWRWVFWILAIAGGITAIGGLLFLQETNAMVLLERKAEKLRKSTGNMELHASMNREVSPGTLLLHGIARPFKLLTQSIIVLCLSLYIALIYGYLYILFTTFTEVFESTYAFNNGTAGLSYLGIGIGFLIGLFIVGNTSDRIFIYLSKKNGRQLPEYRFPIMIVGAIFVPVGLFWYGWSVERHDHWIVPIIGTTPFGIGMISAFFPVQVYLIDAFSYYAASALAATTLLRSLAGAFLPLAGPKMYAKLGFGWGNSLLGIIALAMLPMPVVFFKYGEKIRLRYPVKLG